MRPRRRKRWARGGKGGAEPRAVIRDRAVQVVTLAEQGHTQLEIAGRLGITQAAVSKILHKIDQQVWDELATRRSRFLGRAARLLHHVTRESLRQHEATKDGFTRQRQTKTTGPAGATTVRQEVVIEKRGDPRWLEQVRRTRETAVDLVGGTGTTGTDSEPDTAFDAPSRLLTRLSEDTLERALGDLEPAPPRTE